MPENDKADADNYPQSGKDQSSFWISPVDRTRFITEFILTVALADLVAVQAYIYKKQWTVMDQQFTEFKNQTRQNKLQFRETQENVSAIQSQMQEQSQAMKGQLAAIEKQAGFMETQSQIMADSLAETRKMVEHNEKALKASREHSDRQFAVMEFQAGIAEVHTQVADRTAAAAEKSAEAAQRSVEVMRESALITTRAYVGIREITMSTLALGEIPTLYVVWHNGGQTPAFRFRANVYLVFGDKPEGRGYLFSDDFSDSKANFLPPGPSSSAVPYPQDEYGFKPVTEDFLEDLTNGSKRLYAMVRAIYLDFTDDIRPFNSSYIFNPFEGTFTDLYEYGAENQKPTASGS